MSNISIYSSTPRVNFRGIKDESAVNLAMPVDSLPMRLPLFFGLAQWGPTDAVNYVNKDGLMKVYGDETVNVRGKFYTHQSVFMDAQFTGGGKAIFLRLDVPGAKKANARLVLDIVADKIPEFVRNPDGTIRFDENGNRLTTGNEIDGYRLRWGLRPIPVIEGNLNYGMGSASDGAMVSNETGETSTIYPIMDMEARFKGSHGNNLGFRLVAPTIQSVDAADPDLHERLGSFTYRIVPVIRANEFSTAYPIKTQAGANFLDFTFKSGTLDPKSNTEYFLPKIYRGNYEARSMAAFTGWASFDRLHVYNNHVQTVLQMLAEAEEAITGEEVQDVNLINFLTGQDVNGIHYHSFIVEGPAEGGQLFGESANLFMTGGADGECSVEVYNQLVDELMDNLENHDVPFEDIARVPCDSVWDSGFPVDTKLKFAKFHNLRPDVHVHACTQDVTEPLNSPSKDSSIGVTLRSHYRSMQESSEFGTKALRFTVMANAGYLIDGMYDGIVPFLEYLCLKGAEYMGAENGEMKASAAFGRGEQNVIERYRDHNAGVKRLQARNIDWNNGLNYAEWYDMNRLFWAGLHTIYEVQNSVLSSYFNTCIACNLTRIGHITWREMSGDDRLTDGEFLQAVNQKVIDRTTGKYDDRVNVTPDAHLTALDSALGYSWHLNILMEGEVGRTVENLAIIAQKRRNEG